MTENEAKQKLDSLHYKIVHTSFCNKVYENEIEALCMAKDTLEELQQYRSIGTIEEFKDLKEKNEPEKPLFVPTDDTCLYQEYRCPSCNEWLADKFKPYRCKCGQKLDWE